MALPSPTSRSARGGSSRLFRCRWGSAAQTVPQTVPTRAPLAVAGWRRALLTPENTTAGVGERWPRAFRRLLLYPPELRPHAVRQQLNKLIPPFYPLLPHPRYPSTA